MTPAHRMTVRLIAVILLLAAWPALAAGGVWRGTIGASRVVVELPADGDPIYGRYFYERHRRDIPLEGRREGTALHLHEDAGDWTLDASRPDLLTGEWRGGTRRLPVRLERFRGAAADPERASLAKDDPYAFLRAASMKLVAARVQSVGPYRLQWYVEPTTGVELFRIAQGYDATTRARLNRVLATRHWSDIAAAAECRSMEHGDYTVTTTLRRIAPSILSVSLFASWDCGGAHPDFGDSPLNVDPRTGRELALEDVLWLGTGTPPRMDGPTGSAFFAYREKTLAPWLRRAMARHHPTQMQSGGGDDCDYDDTGVWEFPSWYATDAGLYLGPSFARAARVCEYPEWSVLPWREVKAHPGRVRIAP